MVKFNHFSIVEKTFEEKNSELKSLGFEFDNKSEKEVLNNFFSVAPIDEASLQASDKLSFTSFLNSNENLNWVIFWTLALQVQDFIVNFEFKPEKSIEFAKSINLPMIDSEMSVDNLISAIYLLLLSRRKNGMSLIEYWVSEGLIPVDNQYHFFNDKTLASFDTAVVKREKVWVETSLDSQKCGQYDLVYVEIHRPAFVGKIPVVMTASPYHLGMNETASENRLHKMETELSEKQIHEIITQPVLPVDPNYEKSKVYSTTEAEQSFTHSWTYSLNDYFLARGFASIYVAGIGTKDSDGFQSSGNYQQVYSMKAVIDWLNGRTRAFTSRSREKEVKADWANGKVAMTGQSYLGTMSYGVATTGVDGLEVILTQAGISSWYNYYREGGLVRSPAGFPGEDLDVLAELTYSRNMSGADYLSGNEIYQKQLDEMTRALDRKSGDYNQFWEDRNYLPNVKNVKADVLILHGLQDFNVTTDQAYNYWNAIPETVAKHAFLHRGAHLPIHNWQSIDFTEVINAYFTAKLLGRDLNLNLPPVILQENNKYESWTSLDGWGKSGRLQHNLGSGTTTFENHYNADDFDRYCKDFQVFKNELFEGKTNATIVNIDIPQEIIINGAPELEIKLKINDSRALLSAQLLDFGQKKRLPDHPVTVEANALDRGRLFKQENLVEIPLQNSPYQVISKGFLNLQNRESLMNVSSILPGKWMTFRLKLLPSIYKLNMGDKIRILIYSTDFEHTIRDNREVTYEIDLAASKIILPH
ncbi:Xaa-Pro dipeptidyl-peptidase [Lactovum miscens]|uniref:Xaa-Pro dipeptidyl-peptidase n=1 Tax=Lactovum miscens TaxID=190387 RepID=A0A841C4K3_9LACT|nr:Xaa-Pro dipeptidyl-peptidase [Lactovum miscens]MBB5887274.1 X-Pro dipeptidyl-peptidase [Lactovum miscens]